MKIQELIQKCIIKSYETKENIFDIVLQEIVNYIEKPAHTLDQIKEKESKRVKGLFFEELCKLYLKYVSNYDNVWSLQELPDEILKKLQLRKKDFGIDIICSDKYGYCAVQAKYRKINRSKKNVITWKMLSTFYALCLKTGPYNKYIVITNADYITHMGPKTSKDKTVCLGLWKKIPVEIWLKMANVSSNSVATIKEIEENKENKENEEKLNEEKEKEREKRLLALEKRLSQI